MTSYPSRLRRLRPALPKEKQQLSVGDQIFQDSYIQIPRLEVTLHLKIEAVVGRALSEVLTLDSCKLDQKENT